MKKPYKSEIISEFQTTNSASTILKPSVLKKSKVQWYKADKKTSDRGNNS